MSTPSQEAYTQALNRFNPAKAPAIIGRELTHHDRCDQCGAVAYVRTESYYSTFSLLWCGHHFTEHERNGHFSKDTYAVLDERPFLKAAVHAQANRTEIH